MLTDQDLVRYELWRHIGLPRKRCRGPLGRAPTLRRAQGRIDQNCGLLLQGRLPIFQTQHGTYANVGWYPRRAARHHGCTKLTFLTSGGSTPTATLGTVDARNPTARTTSTSSTTSWSAKMSSSYPSSAARSRSRGATSPTEITTSSWPSELATAST